MPRSGSPPVHDRGCRPRAQLARQADEMAAMVADGLSIHAAGAALDLTKGEAASTWRRIKAGLGVQAS